MTSNGVRILQIGSDRSKRGILHRDSPAFKRQEAYAARFGNLDIIGFSLRFDGARKIETGPLRVMPTNSPSKLLFGWDALRIARTLPRPDVVSGQDPFETGLIGWLISLMKAVPLHVQVHTDFLSPEYARLSLLNRLRVRLAGFVLRRASRIRVGLQDFALAKRFSAYKNKLLVVSRLEPEKNVALAIRPFSEVKPQSACLIVVGGGSERGSLERLARHLGISDRVFFEDGKDVAPYYALTDLVLFPSKYDGYGMVIIEALAAGKPVLSTDVGIAREAGAIIAKPEEFPNALLEWFKSGPRTAELKNYQYKNFDEYIAAYCADIAACADSK